MKDFIVSNDLSVEPGVDVVRLKPKGFEYNFRFFWFLFDWTLGWLLSEWIRFKSYRIALAKTSSPDCFVDHNGDSDKILDLARQSFGPRRVKELFHLRTWGFNSSSKLMQHFCEHAAEAGSLDDVYNAVGSFVVNGKRIFPASASPDVFSRFFLLCPNGQSVRNRYRLVRDLYEESGGGRTLSIACGSAQPLIHAIAELKVSGQSQALNLVLTDTSAASLELARLRSIDAGIADKVECQKVSFLKLREKFQNERFDIVEACGIFDYLGNDQVIDLLKFAFQSLNSGGKVIVSNMAETRGANLLLKTYNWPIIYRSPEDFGRLIKKAGGHNVTVYVEPWGIHPVATATN